jgi:hypothetical protein
VTGLREAAARLADALARAGLDADIWHSTPAEIRRSVEALRRRRGEMDELAWLIGQYAAIGVLAPGRYPPHPNRMRERRAMGEDEMKRLLRDMAERRKRFDP